ncbi:MAG: hypothetical protein PHU56_00980 [Candidatus Pacebacteria bacterium]|nr:hypothetical protein [Candidatus Paceibacterota bacterium]
MKKPFLIVIFIVLLAAGSFFNSVAAQTSSETIEPSSTLQIKSAHSIFQNIASVVKEKAQKITGLDGGELLTQIKAWFSQRKEALKNGWQEERGEFKGGFARILSDVWEKIKETTKKVFHRQ